MGSPASEAGRDDARGLVTRCDRISAGGRSVRGHVRGVGCVRERGRMRGHRSGRRGLGPRSASGDQRELGGRAGVCRGCRGSRGRSTVCLAKRSGSMWRARGRRRRGTGEQRVRTFPLRERISCSSSDGHADTAPVGSFPNRTRLDCMTCWGTYGNGRTIVGTRVTRALRPTGARGQAEIVPVTCVARRLLEQLSGQPPLGVPQQELRREPELTTSGSVWPGQ